MEESTSMHRVNRKHMIWLREQEVIENNLKIVENAEQLYVKLGKQLPPPTLQ